MGFKASIVFSSIVFVAATVVALQQYRFSTSLNRLTRRVADLEVENVQLSEQLADIDITRAADAGQPTSKERRNDERRSTQQPNGSFSKKNPASMPAPKEVIALKATLREEMAQMVEAEQSAAMEKHRAERESRMMNIMSQSIQDFSEDNGLSVDVSDELTRLMDDAMTEWRALREELESENLSFYEYRQEQRKRRESLDDNLSKLLDEKQLDSFRDAFPMGGRGRR